MGEEQVSSCRSGPKVMFKPMESEASASAEE